MSEDEIDIYIRHGDDLDAIRIGTYHVDNVATVLDLVTEYPWLYIDEMHEPQEVRWVTGRRADSALLEVVVG